MKKYSLDTNICVYFLNGKYDLVKKFEEVGIENCAVSEITIAELKYGAEKSSMKKKNRKTVGFFEREFDVLPIYPVLDIYAREKARLKLRGGMVDDFDLLIGATAIYNNRIMVTKNRSHFARLQAIELEDWTENEE